MDLEILEGIALSADRDAALAQLLPGSEDHDYFRAIFAQHRGALDEVDALVEAWPTRHGRTERYQRLRLRQLIYRASAAPARVADQLRDWFGVSHSHEAEVDAQSHDAHRRTAFQSWDPEKMLREAVAQDASLAQVTDEGLLELIGAPLAETHRRALLQRLGHSPRPELVQLVADDLAAWGSQGFGSLGVHRQLTLEQLQQLAEQRPALTGDLQWITAVVQRLRPPAGTDLAEPANRVRYLEHLWTFVGQLPLVALSLQAHVAWHLIDARRRAGLPIDVAVVRAYLAMPRDGHHVAALINEGVRSDLRAQLGASFPTGLPRAGGDEELVRAIIEADPEAAESYATWLERKWLDAEIASARLLAGLPDPDRSTLVLGPARAGALRDRVELMWCADNPARFAADAPVALAADVKNVPELLVKVFRVDPVAYFAKTGAAVDASIDLDGLAASHEEVLRFAEPPVRRVRRRLELPACARPGTYVIDLIGNGMSSRAVIVKGRLRHVVRTGAAGHVVTIVDDTGAKRLDARAWIGEREYAPAPDGTFVVPFSTRGGATPMLLVCGDLATVASLQLADETCELSLDLALDRQSVTSGRTARAIARVALTVGGARASLALLEQPTWYLTLEDRAGVSTTKPVPAQLADGDASVLEIALGEEIAGVHVALRGSVSVRSQQRRVDLEASAGCRVGDAFAGAAIEALYLARPSEGYRLHALGKSGEPCARRPVTIAARHRWTRGNQVAELATDERGCVDLMQLRGCEWLSASHGSASHQWTLDAPAPAIELHALAGEEVRVPLPPNRDATASIHRASIVELRGGAPARHARCELEPLASAIAIHGLPIGEYELRLPGAPPASIRVVGLGAGIASSCALEPLEIVEVPRPAPAIASVAVTDEAIAVRVRGGSAGTRVHAIATRFVPDEVQLPSIAPPHAPHTRADRPAAARYVSGRELGDEYRYVLDRRRRARFPGLLLDKPGLLLDPWARRTTQTGVASARGGGAFGAGSSADDMVASRERMRASLGGGGYGGAPQTLGYDFLGAPPTVLANLALAADGTVNIPRSALGDAASVAILVEDPAGHAVTVAALPDRPLAPRDRRLVVALSPARHATQERRIVALAAGETIAIDDIATAEVHLLDSVERAHAYLVALGADATLRDFGFLARWPSLPEAERRALYGKFACHELRLFLFAKDRAFFDAAIRPHLANRRTKTFVDHWLLGADLAPYLEPARLVRLNAIERALLALRLPADDALARQLADQVATQPRDPERETKLIDTLLGSAVLDGDDSIASARADAFAEAESTDMNASAYAAPMAKAAMAMPMAPGGPPPMTARPAPAPLRAMKKRARDEAPMELDMLAADMDRRAEPVAPLYRAADTTQEWAESSWYRVSPPASAAAAAGQVLPNRFWRDLALHRGDGFASFRSPALGLCTSSLAEALVALAVMDLPFTPAAHAIVADGPRLSITAASPALAGLSQLVDAPLVTGGAPLLVGTSYVRTDDPEVWVDGEPQPKYVTGPLATGVAYTCTVVVANPTGARQRVAALVQIPRGSIALAGRRATETIAMTLPPYGAHGHEYSFYFPAPGAWTHFPVHVARAGQLVAADAPVTLDVQAGGAAPDARSWSHVSQRGSLADVVAYLAGANLAETDLSRAAWRLRDRGAYDAILAALEQRRAYDEALWGYALLHRDAPRIRAWLRALGERLLAAGPVLEPIELDAEDLGAYEHLEYAPLVNARAHALGGKLRILNDGLAGQYERFLDLVAHRAAASAEDLLAAAAYLLAQDRVEPALAVLSRVAPGAVREQMQHAYLAAYAACLAGDPVRARELAQPFADAPIDRWRGRFAALLAMLAEATAGATSQNLDDEDREQRLGDLAAKQPAFELAVDRDGVTIRAHHVASLELRYFEMDVELLFSRQPFVQSDASRFSFIEPGHRELVDPSATPRVPWPAPLRGKHVVVEGVGAGLRRSQVHYANELGIALTPVYGRLRVLRASDGAPLPATYVKVYARRHGGAVAFYKDGYSDLRGWFDYATLSTTDLDDVERFAILVVSDACGAAIHEAAPPVR